MLPVNPASGTNPKVPFAPTNVICPRSPVVFTKGGLKRNVSASGSESLASKPWSADTWSSCPSCTTYVSSTATGDWFGI